MFSRVFVFLFFCLFVVSSTHAQLQPQKPAQIKIQTKIPSKNKVTKKIKELSLKEQLFTHWKPLKGDEALNALAKVSVGKWVPAPRGIYPMQWIHEEIEKFEKQNGKITHKSQAEVLKKKLKPYLPRISELPVKNVEKWIQTCRYEPLIEELLPTEVIGSETYQKLNLKGAYLFEDPMGFFLNVMALKDDKVWVRTYANLIEEESEKTKIFQATMPLVDFSYVLRKSFEEKKCLGRP